MLASTPHEPLPPAKAERMTVGTMTSFASTVVARIAGIVNSVIIVRALGVNDVGVFAIIGLIMAVASVTSNVGVPPALVKFLAEVSPNRSRDLGRLLGAGLVIIMLATAATVGVLLVLAPFLANSVYNDPRISGFILVALLGLGISSFAAPFLSTFQGLELIREMNIREMVVASASIPVTYVIVQNFGLLGAVLVGVLAAVLGILIKFPVLRHVWRRYEVRITIPKDRFFYGRILNFAVPAFTSTLMVTSVMWVSNSLLATERSFSALGEYSVAYGLAGYLLLISASVGIPMVPVVSRLDREDSGQVAEFMVKTFRITAFLTLPMAIVLIALPSPFLRLLYGAQYATAASLVVILGPATMLASLSSVVGYAIAGVGRMWDGFVLNLVWGVGMVILAFLLVPTYGGTGLALAFLGAYLVHFLSILMYMRLAWSISVSSVAVPLAISVGALSGAAFAFMLARPWNYVVVVVEVGLVVLIEWFAMSPRELEVVLRPLRRVLVWIARFQ